MSQIANPQTAWIDEGQPSDAAPITSIWKDADVGAAVPLAAAFLVDDGTGDLAYAPTGPADAELIDSTGTDVFELTLLPTGLSGPRASAMYLGGAGNILIF